MNGRGPGRMSPPPQLAEGGWSDPPQANHPPPTAGGGGYRAARSTSAPTLRGYTRFVRRHRAFIYTMALLGATCGAVLIALSPPLYVAQTKVAVTAQPTGADIDPDRPRLVSLDSDAQVLSSGAVLARAAEISVFPGGAAALADSLSVSAVPNSRVLIVRVSHPDRDVALRASGAVVSEFLRTRADTDRVRADTATAALDLQISDVLARLVALRASAATGATGTDLGTTVVELADDELAELAELEGELRRVTSAGSAPPGTVVAPPDAPPQGIRPMAPATAVTGVLLGAVTGVTAAGTGLTAWLSARRRRRS